MSQVKLAPPPCFGGLFVSEPRAPKNHDRALAAGQDSAYSFEADDGRYTILLRRVVYVKRFARESRVGFGAAA